MALDVSTSSSTFSEDCGTADLDVRVAAVSDELLVGLETFLVAEDVVSGWRWAFMIAKSS